MVNHRATQPGMSTRTSPLLSVICLSTLWSPRISLTGELASLLFEDWIHTYLFAKHQEYFGECR